jgi:hypothetical protein
MNLRTSRRVEMFVIVAVMLGGVGGAQVGCVEEHEGGRELGPQLRAGDTDTDTDTDTDGDTDTDDDPDECDDPPDKWWECYCTCDGCCDEFSNCAVGNAPGACGAKGTTCKVCAPEALCSGGECFIP